MRRAAGAWLTALVLVNAAALSACSEPLEFADWTLPVPEGTQIIEYEGIAIEDRSETLELAVDLVVDASDGDSNKAFFNPITVSVDSDSERVYVYDAGNSRIQVFDRDGRYLQTIGRAGSGPGEIERGGRVTIADDRLVHIGLGRINIWDLDGEIVDSRQSDLGLFSDIIGLPGARVVGFTWERPDQETRRRVFRRIDLEGTVEHRYMDLRDNGSPFFRRSNASLNSRAPVGSPDLAASADGDLYFASGDEYQVLATRVDGEPRWALRVAWVRIPISGAEIDDFVKGARERMPDANRDELDWPTHRPALARVSSVQVDGHGNLFVFPTVPPGWPSETRVVDVYSPDGELLFAGNMRRINWRASLGDYVYALETDPDSEETVLVRYRLELPGR